MYHLGDHDPGVLRERVLVKNVLSSAQQYARARAAQQRTRTKSALSLPRPPVPPVPTGEQPLLQAPRTNSVVLNPAAEPIKVATPPVPPRPSAQALEAAHGPPLPILNPIVEMEF